MDTPPGHAWTPGPQSSEIVARFSRVGFIFLGRGLIASIKLPEGQGRGAPSRREDWQAQRTGSLTVGICGGQRAGSTPGVCKDLAAPAAAALAPGEAVWNRPLQPKSSWRVLPAGAGCRNSRDRWCLCGPLCLPHTPVWKVAFAGGPPRASSWRKRKAGAGIGSPEGGAKPPQGCGWEVRVEACCQAGDGASHLALPGRLRPLPCPLLSLLEHLWGLCPGAEGPPSGPPAERREGRPGHPRRARL